MPLSALDAVIAIDPPGLRERLLEMLRKGTPIDGRVAGWFVDHPGADAVEPLRTMAARWGEFTWERKRAPAALKACGVEGPGR